KFATVAGKTAKFSFTGSQVAWVSTLGTNRGSATAALDGGTAATVNTQGTALKPAMGVYTKKGAVGAHSLRVKVLGRAGHPRGGRGAGGWTGTASWSSREPITEGARRAPRRAPFALARW